MIVLRLFFDSVHLFIERIVENGRSLRKWDQYDVTGSLPARRSSVEGE